MPELTAELILGSLPGGSFRTPAVFDEIYIFESCLSDENIKRLVGNDICTDISMEFSYYPVDIKKNAVVRLIYSGAVSADKIKFGWTSSDESVAVVDETGQITP